MREVAEKRLRLEDLAPRGTRLLQTAERRAVRHGVVADPVAFGVRPDGECATRRIGELRAEHEEGGGYAFAPQDFEDAAGDAGLGPVVEGEGDFHFGGTLARWTICKRRCATKRGRKNVCSTRRRTCRKPSSQRRARSCSAACCAR